MKTVVKNHQKLGIKLTKMWKKCEKMIKNFKNSEKLKKVLKKPSRKIFNWKKIYHNTWKNGKNDQKIDE